MIKILNTIGFTEAPNVIFGPKCLSYSCLCLRAHSGVKLGYGLKKSACKGEQAPSTKKKGEHPPSLNRETRVVTKF